MIDFTAARPICGGIQQDKGGSGTAFEASARTADLNLGPSDLCF